MTSAPGKGLDKFRSAAHKMHLGTHSNEPCQLLLRVSPQRVCSTKSLWAQSCALCPGAPQHTQPGSCPLLVCLAGGICTVGTNIMYPLDYQSLVVCRCLPPSSVWCAASLYQAHESASGCAQAFAAYSTILS